MQVLNSAHPDFWSKREESFEEEPPARNMITVVCQIIVILCADIDRHDSAYTLCDHDISCMWSPGGIKNKTIVLRIQTSSVVHKKSDLKLCVTNCTQK